MEVPHTGQPSKEPPLALHPDRMKLLDLPNLPPDVPNVVRRFACGQDVSANKLLRGLHVIDRQASFGPIQQVLHDLIPTIDLDEETSPQLLPPAGVAFNLFYAGPVTRLADFIAKHAALAPYVQQLTAIPTAHSAADVDTFFKCRKQFARAGVIDLTLETLDSDGNATADLCAAWLTHAAADPRVRVVTLDAGKVNLADVHGAEASLKQLLTHVHALALIVRPQDLQTVTNPLTTPHQQPSATGLESLALTTNWLEADANIQTDWMNHWLDLIRRLLQAHPDLRVLQIDRPTPPAGLLTRDALLAMAGNFTPRVVGHMFTKRPECDVDYLIKACTSRNRRLTVLHGAESLALQVFTGSGRPGKDPAALLAYYLHQIAEDDATDRLAVTATVASGGPKSKPGSLPGSPEDLSLDLVIEFALQAALTDNYANLHNGVEACCHMLRKCIGNVFPQLAEPPHREIFSCLRDLLRESFMQPHDPTAAVLPRNQPAPRDCVTLTRQWLGASFLLYEDAPPGTDTGAKMFLADVRPFVSELLNGVEQYVKEAYPTIEPLAINTLLAKLRAAAFDRAFMPHLEGVYRQCMNFTGPLVAAHTE